MKYGHIEAIFATSEMEIELANRGHLTVLCTEGFQHLLKEETSDSFWMNGLRVNAIARNERATVILVKEA